MERALGRVRHLAGTAPLGLPLHLARTRQAKRVLSLALAAAAVQEAAALLATLKGTEATLLTQVNSHSAPAPAMRLCLWPRAGLQQSFADGTADG